MPEVHGHMAQDKPSRGWPRAIALFVVTMAVSLVQPSVLVAIPFLALAVVLGARTPAVYVAGGLGLLMVMAGPREGLWFVERGWGLLLGGWFAALSLWRPQASFSERALGAVAGTAAAAAGFMLFSSGAWEAIDWAFTDRLRTGVATAIQAMELLRDGEALSPALVTMVYETVEAQALVYPAMLGLASMAGLGVAWWIYVRLTSGSDQGVGPLQDFRFNDHLVWVFIAGLALVMLRAGEAHARVGANAVVFMGLLYALRGAAVVMFVSSGFSIFGYAMVAFGLVFASPVIVGAAMIIGIGDTWLDVRGRTADGAA